MIIIIKNFIKTSLIKLGFRIIRLNYKDCKPFLDKNIIFIHIPKVAGNGILKSLDLTTPGHLHLYEYEILYDLNLDEYFKISFVRNPWDRLVSAYHYLKNGGMKDKFPKDGEMQKKLNKFDSFNEFIYKLSEDENYKNNILKRVHFKPQFSWLINTSGKIEIDYIGKFEDINDGFRVLKNKLDKPDSRLQVYNKSDHKPYWKYYNKKSVDIVKNLYKEDIELFDYKFPYEKLD